LGISILKTTTYRHCEPFCRQSVGKGAAVPLSRRLPRLAGAKTQPKKHTDDVLLISTLPDLFRHPHISALNLETPEQALLR
jgi:hypothetical protein